MKIITILNGFLVGIIVLGILYLLPDSKEGFVPKRYDIAPKKYSIAHSKNLLENEYKEKKLNNDTYFTISKLYPKIYKKILCLADSCAALPCYGRL